MEFLSSEQILRIHSVIISQTGGSHGVRDRNSLMMLDELPKQCVFGKELYPTLFLKAAVYARTIMFSHPFIDGNKRTGMSIAAVFIENNGYRIVAKRGEIEDVALRIVTEKMGIEEIGDWFKNHTKKNTGA